ncbi:unnamed protein product [Effrenium voratum]|uniref:Glutamine amidotransferase type-2 domain-containing protein n=1 Tax=Effrenium voratum TaxID=2562239 RepID=A0AA36J173_9DINO|nr:unnamed protein product [Effrenium voratum]
MPTRLPSKSLLCYGFGVLVGLVTVSLTDVGGLLDPANTNVRDVLRQELPAQSSRPAGSVESTMTKPESKEETGETREPACRLPLCVLTGVGATRLFILEHTDGAGHRMKSILEAVAIAHRNHINFGGLVGQLQPLTDQHINFRIITDAIFGDGASKELYIYNISRKPQIHGTFNDAKQLEARLPGVAKGKTLYCHAVNEWGYDRRVPTSSYFPGWLRDEMRKHLDARPLVFAPGKTSVVIHLRRADLERDDTRATKDSYYYRLAKEIRELAPPDELDFHVWSSPKNIPAVEQDYWKSSDYDGYRERGMTVHLDKHIDSNEDMLTAWTHMARAHILIMSQSSFSMVPAYMNTNCVIYPSNIDSPLENWVNGRDEDRQAYQQEVESCVRRVRKIVPQTAEVTDTEQPAPAEMRCELKVCNLHSLSAPRLYILEHTDGAGHRLKSVLEAIAISWRNKLNFGGLVGQLQPLTDQHINSRVVVDALFGAGASRHLFIYNISSKPSFTSEFSNARELETKVPTLRPNDLAYCHAVNEWGYDRRVPTSSYFPGWLRDEMRKHLDARPLVFAPGKTSVVIHLRRADLERDDTRATKDSYYYRLAKEIRELAPPDELDFHVWSSPKNIPAVEQDYWKSSDYDGYRERGMTVHLDKHIDSNEDMLTAWTHMARAHILIMSQSSFSMVPAYMNTNCVIYPSNIDSPLENWMDGKDTKNSKYKSSLEKCVKDALQRGFDFVHNLLHMTGDKVLQPFHDPSAMVVALFNGEIYNWEELQVEPASFRSDGDALLSEYRRHGGDFVKRLDGEFALALFDFARREAFLARDPFGSKPLWFARGDGKFAVSSYASALRRLDFKDAEIHQVEPNSVLVLELPAAASEPPVKPTEAPAIARQTTVFEFDLRQHKTSTSDWQKAFVRAVQKRTGSSRFAPGRATPAMCLSDGYDSGSIALSLGKLGIQPAMYTVQAREDVRVLVARLVELSRRVNSTWKLTQLSTEQFQKEKLFLHDRAERVLYKLRPGYANVDDKAAAGLSWIYRQASFAGQRMFLSGTGADEIISDYGTNGVAFEFHSTLRGEFPEELSSVFPWLNFFLGTQRDYLAKEESTAGAHGVETRYPFLDRNLVQEFLWLSADTKNALYKAPIHEFLEAERFPFVRGTKRGFSADRNLVGDVDEDQDEISQARRKFWSGLGAAEGTVIAAFASQPAASQSAAGASAQSPADSATVIPAPLRRLVEVTQGPRRWRRWRKRIHRQWAAGILRDLPSVQRAETAKQQGPLAPVLSLAVANGVGPNNRAVILTSCMEEHYFWTYCGPFLHSVAEAFDLFESPGPVRAMVATAGIEPQSLEAVARLLPFVEFSAFHEHEDQLSSHSDPTEAESYRRLSYQSLKLQQYLWLWQRKLLPEKEVDFVICMDSDMLVVKPFLHVFELLQQRQVDVAFSYYDGTRHVPWGSPAELARTKKKGLVRLQGGMLIMRNSVEAIQWFATWKSLTEAALFHKENEGELGDRWRDLLEEFKGPSQAALAFLLTQGDVDIMKDVSACCSSLRSIEPLGRAWRREWPKRCFRAA